MALSPNPKVLMAIKDLELAAKTTIDGFMSGINKSTIKGQGLEFSQYRSYQAGDDLRSLDWKMFARSDRYYIRESEVETNITVRFVIDASASMNHSDGDLKKIDYARYLAASFAYMANKQGDATALYVLKNNGLFSMVARQDYQHLKRLFYQLQQIKPEGNIGTPITYKDIYAGSQKRELLVFISDLYEENNEITLLLDALSALKHEVIVFQVMAENELNFNYKGFTTLQDLETGKTIKINSSETKKSYQESLNNYLKNIRTKLLDRNIFYRLAPMNEPLDQFLRDFLKQRMKAF